MSSDLVPAVLITGGRGDLAQAISTRFERAGWSVFAPGREELDVTSKDSVDAYFAGLDQSLALLVNNAGTTRDSLLGRMSAEDWDTVIKTNLKGAFLCSQAASRTMVRQRAGQIVNIGSFSAIRAPAGQANYAAAKAGLIGLTKSLAKELGKRQIRVNCVLPGFLETKMTRDLSSEVIENAKSQHTLGKFNTPSDVAEFLLCLQGLTAISGQVFQLDSRVAPW